MATELWSGLTDRGNVLTTELNALANGNFSVKGTEFANQTHLAVWGILRLSVDFVSAPTDEATVELYMHAALDGTNYTDGDASTHPAQQLYAGEWSFDDVTAVQALDCVPFRLVPAKLKFQVRNRSGQDFPGTGSTVRLYTFNRTIG